MNLNYDSESDLIKDHFRQELDEIVQNFINLCSIKQHELYSRSETTCDDRVTYYPHPPNFFETDSVTISKQCSIDATEYLIDSLKKYNEK